MAKKSRILVSRSMPRSFNLNGTRTMKCSVSSWFFKLFRLLFLYRKISTSSTFGRYSPPMDSLSSKWTPPNPKRHLPNGPGHTPFLLSELIRDPSSFTIKNTKKKYPLWVSMAKRLSLEIGIRKEC